MDIYVGKSGAPIGRITNGMVGRDSGAYMRAVAEIGLAGPETLRIVVKNPRSLPTDCRSFARAGSAAGMCAELGSRAVRSGS